MHWFHRLIAVAALSCAACPGDRAPAVEPMPQPVAPEPAAEPAPVAQPEAPAAEPEVPRADDGVVLLEGTPAIPAEVLEQLEQYINTRSASVADISDDGKTLLIKTRFGDTNQLHLVRWPLAARYQLTFEEEPIGGAAFVPGSIDEILFTADTGGDEQHQIYHRNLATSATTQLTEPGSRNGSVLWYRDGSKLAFSSNRRNQRDFDIWLSDGRTAGSARLLIETKGWWYPIDWSRDGKQLLVGEYVSVNDSRVYLADAETGKLERLTPEDTPAAHGAAVFARDGKSVFLTSDRDGEFTELYQLDLAKKTWKPLTRHIPWNVGSLTLSTDGRTLAFTTNEDGYDVLHLLDTRTGKEKPAKNVPRGIIGGVQFARDSRDQLAFTLLRPTDSGDAYLYDTRRAKLTRWTQSEMGGLDPDQMIEPTLVHYPTFDGAKIPAFYYKPAGEGPFPSVVMIHGGPEGQSRPYFSYTTQYLLSRGIAVLYPNVRGSSGYGKTYLTLDNADKREDSVKDIGALLDWIAAREDLDGDRVAVYGGSYGGYMVLAALVHYSDRLVAGVDVVGISNFVTFLENTADYRRDLRRVEYGDERDPEMRKHLEAISPLNHVDKIKAALFVAQGANDPRVPATEAEQIVNAVRNAGHDVWYMLARNEGHGFSKKANRDTFTALSMIFLEKHLLGEGE